MPDAPLFTIFTATFNRRDTLARAFHSIQRQTLRDLEWVIVDDGSTDGTEEEVRRFAEAAPFPIKFLRQPNLGKYRAWNAGIRAATGALVANLDSDDEYLPDALERLHLAWQDLPSGDRNRFVGVTGLCLDEQGNVVGDRFPSSPFDSDSATAGLGLDVQGDKAGFLRRDVALAHPFPEDLPTRFIPEGRIWLEIARFYKTRFINEPVLLIHDSGNGRLSRLDRLERAPGDLEYNRFALAHFGTRFRRRGLKAAILMSRAALLLGMTPIEIVKLPATAFGKLATVAGYPLASFLYRRDLIRAYGRVGLLASVTRALPRFVDSRPLRHIACALVASSPDRRLEANVLDFKMSLDLNAPLDVAALLFPRFLVSRGVRFVRHKLAQGGTFIDVGAGVGFCSLYLSRKRTDRVFVAVERDADQRALLERNLQLSSVANVSVHGDLASFCDADHFVELPRPVIIRIGADAWQGGSANVLWSETLAKVSPDVVLVEGASPVSEWLAANKYLERHAAKSERIFVRNTTDSAEANSR
uniref:glycosyltransferase n=1 Tax=Altererythrobacter segetis TaxID=1104773 RepID=UPI00140B81C0|nr:glycosyltransferase [Altererythrobacter segetis]